MTIRVDDDDRDELVLTVDETRVLLKISRTATYEAIRRGEIPSIRIGRRVLVPMAGLKEMLDKS